MKSHNPYHTRFDVIDEEPEYDCSPPDFDYTTPNPESGISITNTKYNRIINTTKNPKYIHLAKIDRWLSEKQALEYQMGIYFDRLINLFDLNEATKKFLRKEVEYSKPQKAEDIIYTVFNSIIKHNFPITTSEFRKAIRHEFKIKVSGNPNLFGNARDYTWYIHRILANIKISQLHYQKVFKKVRENFHKLQPVIKRNPCTLIAVLCRLSYKFIIGRPLPNYEEFFLDIGSYKNYRKVLTNLGINVYKYKGREKEYQKKQRQKKQGSNNKEYHQQYYQENKQKWKTDYKEKQLKTIKKWQQENPEKVKKHKHTYYEKNKNNNQ